MSDRTTRFNRRKKLAKIIEEDIGPGNEFTVYEVQGYWSRRWSRVPSIKELSKVLPSNPALERHRLEKQNCMVYLWDGKTDLREYICETDEQLAHYREKRLKEKDCPSQ